jgi:hypothetical protein
LEMGWSVSDARKITMRQEKRERLWCVEELGAAVSVEGAAMELHSGSSLVEGYAAEERGAWKLLEGNARRDGGVCDYAIAAIELALEFGIETDGPW